MRVQSLVQRPVLNCWSAYPEQHFGGFSAKLCPLSAWASRVGGATLNQMKPTHSSASQPQINSMGGGPLNFPTFNNLLPDFEATTHHLLSGFSHEIFFNQRGLENPPKLHKGHTFLMSMFFLLSSSAPFLWWGFLVLVNGRKPLESPTVLVTAVFCPHPRALGLLIELVYTLCF